MNFSLYIAKRYLRSKSKNSAINIISAISSFGIIVGAMALFVVLSVFSGLRDFSLSFSNDFDPDLKISPKLGKSIIISNQQEKELRKIKGITTVTKTIEEKALFAYKGKEQVALIKGVDEKYSEVNNVSKTIFQGRWLSPETPQVVIGNGISQNLSLGLFDYQNDFEVYIPKPGKGTIDNPDEAFNKTQLIPIGIYAISEELDSKYVFTNVKLAQELLQFSPNEFSGVEIKKDSLSNENEIINSIQSIFSNTVEVKTRAQLNDSLYKMLNTENTAVYLIFTLVIIMTLFTLAGAIIMMIIEKKDNLKTLLALGTTIKETKQIFLLQGILNTIFGGVLGILIGIALILIQQNYNVIMITESLAYPVKFTFQNIFIVLATIITLGFLASYIASSRVNKKLFEN